MYGNLLAEIGRRQLSRKLIAEKLGISTSSLRHKINGENKFLLDEAFILCELLGNPSVEWLFSKTNISA